MADERNKYADFEELVFENRNKEYGAYDLRKSYKGLLTKAFFIGSNCFTFHLYESYRRRKSKGS